MMTTTCWLTFCDSWAACADVIGASATFDAAGAAVAATAATDCPATKAGTDIAAITSGMTLLLACARNAPPVMRPCMLPHPVGGRGQPHSERVPAHRGPGGQDLNDIQAGTLAVLKEHENFLLYNFSITNRRHWPAKTQSVTYGLAHLCLNSVDIDLVSVFMGALLSRDGQ